MSSASKRKEITTPPVSQKKKPSQRVRFNKNKKLRWENAEKTKQESIPPVPASSMELDIIFNLSKVLILFLPPYTEKLLISYFFVLIRELRSEEHTSELQSHHDLVCRLLLEKKKKETKIK